MTGDFKSNLKLALLATGSLLTDWRALPEDSQTAPRPRGWRTAPSEFLRSKPLFLCLLPAASHPLSRLPRSLVPAELGLGQQALTRPLLAQLPRRELATGRQRGPSLVLALTAWGGTQGPALPCVPGKVSFRKKALVPQRQEAPPRLTIHGAGYFPSAR